MYVYMYVLYFVIVDDNKTAEPTSSVDKTGSFQSVTPTTRERSRSLDSKCIYPCCSYNYSMYVRPCNIFLPKKSSYYNVRLHA